MRGRRKIIPRFSNILYAFSVSSIIVFSSEFVAYKFDFLQLDYYIKEVFDIPEILVFDEKFFCSD